MLSSDDDQVIVVRFWSEDGATVSRSTRSWRARITYVNTGQRFYARSISDAFAVMRSLILTGEYNN